MKTLKGVIDRFEGEFAVIQIVGEAEIHNVMKKLLPRRAKEGDYLELQMEDEQIVGAKLDLEATEEARKRIQDKLGRLRRGEHLNREDGKV